MTLCVCGHTYRAHLPVVMSVPLRGLGLYPAVGSLANITTGHPRATYIRDECACGCGCYLPDTGYD